MTLASLYAELASEEWAMEPEALAALARAASSVDPAKVAAWIPADAPARLPYAMSGSTAVVSVSGTLMKRVPAWAKFLGLNVTETPGIKRAIEQAVADPRVESIALSVDSPGGQAAGVLDVAQSIRDARSRKPVVAQVEGLAASGGYWLASQASEISAAPDAKVGSIGVYTVAVDESARAEREGVKVHVIRSGAHKGAGEPGAPITAEHLAATQSLVDGIAGLFVADVAAGRGVSPDKIKPHATGQVWLAAEAKSFGLVDHVEPVGRALSRLAPNPKEAPMAEQKTNDEAAKAAVIADRERCKAIRAAFPNDREFADAQCDVGATLAEAKVAYFDIAQQKLADAEAKAKALEESAKKPATPTPSPAPTGGAPVLPRGGDPAQAKVLGFYETAEAHAAEKKIPLSKAMSEVAKKQPELHASYVAECAAKAPQHNARKRALGIR